MDRLQKAVGELILNRNFTVAKQDVNIKLIKMFGKRPVVVLLERIPMGGFWIRNPSREDRSVNAFFDYPDTPTRVTRNKDLIKYLVKHLKKSLIWEFIENKDFFVINKHNKKANKTVVKNIFSKIKKG